MKIGDLVKPKERDEPWQDLAGSVIRIITETVYVVKFRDDMIIGFPEESLDVLTPIPQEHMEKILEDGGAC